VLDGPGLKEKKKWSHPKRKSERKVQNPEGRIVDRATLGFRGKGLIARAKKENLGGRPQATAEKSWGF